MEVPIKVIVFPLRDNPYQKYLYDEVEKNIGRENIFYFSDIDVSNRKNFVTFVLTWPLKLAKISGSKKIFHLHWQFFYFLLNKKARTVPSILLCLWILSWVKLFGFKIVWTAHDYNQHDTNAQLDIYIRNILLKFTSKIIVLNKITEKMLRENDHVRVEDMRLIPIGNYGTDPVYVPNTPSQIFVISFFGLIRKYKGVDRLIKVFKTIKESNLRLVIKGGCYDKEYFSEMAKDASTDKRITIEDTYLSEADLTELAHTSNIVALPFIEVTNSSSAMLAYSKGRPTIAPLIGAFKDQPSSIGFFYVENTEEGLRNAILKAFNSKNKLKSMGKEALEYASSFQWPKIGKETVALYESIFI